MKKDYILYSPAPAKAQGAPAFVQRAMTWAKATNEITGLIRGILADGVVSEGEAVYLREWIASRPELLRDSLVRALAERVKRIFDDGIITPEELEDLKQVLSEFTPGGDAPAALPLDHPEPGIIIPKNTFCFTGTFVSGKRSWCIEQIEIRGGMAIDAVLENLNYLVIGSKISGAWRNQTYGKKIEAAVDLKQRGHAVKIVCEDHWIKSL